MLYKEQLEIVNGYRVRDGQTYRGNCPVCGGRNTFTITNRGGVFAWNCFKASCDIGGRREGERTGSGLRTWQSGEQPPTRLLAPIPEVLTSIQNRPDALEYLEQVHSLEAFRKGLVEIRYSPTEDRIMFPVGSEGYTGRGRKGVFPKWKKFGDCSSLFSCGKGKIGVVLEDAPSACAVGIIPQYTGLSLLGTNLTTIHKSQLRQYEKVLICLDPDAASKSLSLVTQLRGTIEATMKLIPDDLKNYEADYIERILNA